MTATKIDLTTGEQVQGTLPVANGGSGTGTLTGLVKGNGTSAFAAVTAPSGAVVGTSDSQALTHKDLTDATNTFPSSFGAPTFDALTTQGSATLPAGIDLSTAGPLEIAAADGLEIPATSTLEIPFWLSASPFQATATATVVASESTSSSTYVDLTTTTDQVTVTIGPNRMALVVITGCQSAANTDGTLIMTAVAISGANTLAASDALSLSISNRGGTGANSSVFFLTSAQLPNIGLTTFKLKYRCTGGTMGMSNRSITVIPL